jgi:preprotein translocase subunit SecD
MKISPWKVILSILVTILALICAWPNFTDKKLPSWVPSNKVNLGLDLRGGAHLLLGVDFKSYLNDTLEMVADNIRKELRNEKLGYKNLAIKDSEIRFELRDGVDFVDVRKSIKKVDPRILVEEQDRYAVVKYNEDELKNLKDRVIDQSIEIVRMRVDSSGTKEPIIQRQGADYILLQVPGEDNPQHLKNILGKTAKLTFHLVDEMANLDEALKGHVPSGTFLAKGEVEGGREYYVLVNKKVIVSGDQLVSAQATFNQHSQAVVAFSFNNLGAKLFAEVTKNNSGKRLAIVLDNKLLSAPVINEPIMGGSGTISGNFTVESANELALLLRAGALPAPLTIIEERSIGPNLGADSIASGTKAGIIGFIFVVVFMTLSYGVLGIFANIALSLALLYILALLSVLQATLTLPGIAGIILTIGMAVDANVLIYERIREELMKGSSNLYAIKQGFESAFATIADSNITTLIAAFLLYAFGVGAIKGFAVTLTIGIISSMFAAIIITKLLIDIWVRFFKPKKLGI